jgi:DNA repair protein RadC
MELTSPELAHRYLHCRMNSEVEEFWAIALNSGKTVIRARCLFRGSVDACLFHPRDVFRFACLHNAAALIVAHNHPSGNVLPSADDERITQRLLAAAMVFQLPVVDHLIVAGKNYFSFLAAGKMKLTNPVWPDGR